MKIQVGIWKVDYRTSLPWHAGIFNTGITGTGATKQEAIDQVILLAQESLRGRYKEVLEVEVEI